MSSETELIYLMDPHCGWCFGFGKVILELWESYEQVPSVRIDIRPGGLFSPAIETDDSFANDKRPIARRIERLSGVNFSESYFSSVIGNGGFLDSEPPSRAILCVREIQDGILVPFMEKLFEKEFALGRNSSSDDTIFEAVEELGIDEADFEMRYRSDEFRRRTLLEFQQARKMASGYPTLFAKHGNQIEKLAGGFAPAEELLEKIEAIRG